MKRSAIRGESWIPLRSSSFVARMKRSAIRDPSCAHSLFFMDWRTVLGALGDWFVRVVFSFHCLCILRLREALDGDGAIIGDVQQDTGAVEQAHADERSALRREHHHGLDLAIPNHRTREHI